MRGRYESKEVCAVLAAGEAAEKREPEEAGEEGRKVNGLEGSSEGGERRPALDVRLRGWRLPALAIALLFAALFPKVALAASEQVIIDDGYVFYQGSDRVDRGFMVMAYNRLNAGALICGYDPNNFTTEQKAKLTQYTSGNNFYQLCESLQTVSESGVPSWASSQYNLFGTIWNINSDFEGMEVYYGGFSENELELAKRDIQKVLNGEELQPPSGGGGGASTNWKTAYHQSYNSNDKLTATDGSIYSASVEVPDGVKQMPPYITLDLQGETPELAKTDTCYVQATFSGSNLTVMVTTFDRPMTVETITDAMGNEFECKYVNNAGDGNYKHRTMYMYTIDTYDATSNVITCTYNRTTSNQSYMYNGNSDAPSFSRTAFMYGTYGGNPNPPGNWPDNPTVVAPEPPELPEPRDPVIPNPPADPVPTDPPTYITQPTYNVSVFTADLQGILDAMDEHCIHLQNALYTDLNALYNKLASTITEDNQKTRTLISNRFTWLGNVISECLDTLNDNLYDYFHWLGEQFDFQNSGGYNDSTVVAWLKKIYAKLGGGSPVNPKPVDPVSDPFDFGKWLSDLWNTFIADLIAIGAEGMAAIADDLQQLIHKFPFSIPWDIAAMLALLVAEPQTPVIQFPMFSYNGSVQVIQTTIDLTPYNNYVEPVRVMIKIGFAAVLAWRTKDMMELLTMARGGNNA